MAIPVAAKVLNPSASKTTAALGRAARQLRAMGAVSERRAMGMGAVMGAVQG
jgi:hypothetical protein